MSAQQAVRASGRTAAEESTREAAQEADKPVEPELDVERRRRFRSPSFSRMVLDPHPDDQIMMTRIHAAVFKRIQAEFADLLDLWYSLVIRVREIEEDEHGSAIPDKDGYPTFKRTASGAYIEHWDRLVAKDREKYIFQITTSLLEWEERATRLWAEAMMAKAQWEEVYGLGFESLDPKNRPTIQDREARAKVDSAEARYRAIFVSYYSRVADGHVRNMQALGQRLKDVHMAASGRG